jgi:DNA-binding response OmpR family regulator
VPSQILIAEDEPNLRRVLAAQLQRDGYEVLLAELTDAEGALTNARLQMADAHVAARIALTQLRHALGRDQREQKAQRAGVGP